MVVRKSLPTDSAAAAVVGMTLAVAVVVLGMTWQVVAAGPAGMHRQDNSAEVQSVAAPNTLHYHVNNITSYHTG